MTTKNADSGLNWGIAGTGKISHDFVHALRTLSSKQHRVIAVASRQKKTAKKFAIEFGILNFYNNYSKLAERAEINVVYVAVINVLHFPVCQTMLLAGKNVLCETPFAINQNQAEELYMIARNKKLFIMDGIWSRCFPVYRHLEASLTKIGQILQISADIGAFQYSNYSNTEHTNTVSILELAVYVFQLAQLVFKAHCKMNVCSHIQAQGRNSTCGITLIYPHSRMAMLCVSNTIKLQGQAIIYGTRGNIEIKDFWCPTVISVNGISKTYPLMKNRGQFNYYNGAGYAYEAEEVRNCILNGLTESSLITHNDSIAIAKLLDELRYQIGAFFPEDHPDQNCQQDQLFTPTSSVQQ